MTDVLIRDVPDDVIAALDSHARRLGLSRTSLPWYGSRLAWTPLADRGQHQHPAAASRERRDAACRGVARAGSGGQFLELHRHGLIRAGEGRLRQLRRGCLGGQVGCPGGRVELGAGRRGLRGP